MIDTFPNKRRQFLISLLLIVATLAVYWQVRHHEFINIDDNIYIIENTQVQKGFTGESIAWAFTTGYSANWHPLTWISHMLDYQLYGLNPTGHHLTNLLFHIINTILLFIVFKRMTKSIWPSAFVAAIFALHPLHVESVAWATERKDTLSTFFWVLTMWAYVRYLEQPDWKRYMLAVLLFVLGLMSKPMLVTLPFVLLLMDYWPLRRLEAEKQSGSGERKVSKERNVINRKAQIIDLVKEKISFFALAAVSSVITFFVQRNSGVMSSWEGLPMDIRLANASVAYANYIVKTIWPTGLAMFYPLLMSRLPAWQIVAAGLTLVSLSIAVIRAARRCPYLVVGWLWYVGTLVPVIGIVQVGAQSMADRYMYVPMIGLTIMMVWAAADLVDRLSIRRVVVSATAVAMVVVFSAVTWMQVGYWRNSITLFEHALDVTTDNWFVHQNLGDALTGQGKISEAMAHYNEEIRIKPDYAQAHNNLGVALYSQGQLKEAIAQYNEALMLEPNLPEAHYSLGVILHNQGKIKEAIAHYNEALKIKPIHAQAHNNLGAALYSQGQVKEAIAQYNEALKIKPDNAQAHNNLGVALYSQGQVKEAIAHYNEALKIKPDYTDARNNLAIALASQNQSKQQ